MFKKIFVLSLLCLSLAVIVRATEDEEPAAVDAPVGDVTDEGAVATDGEGGDADADDTEKAGKGSGKKPAAGAGDDEITVGAILKFVKEKCKAIVDFISGKSSGDASSSAESGEEKLPKEKGGKRKGHKGNKTAESNATKEEPAADAAPAGGEAAGGEAVEE